MRRTTSAVLGMLSIGLVGCAEAPTSPTAASLSVNFLTPATVRTVTVEVDGPGLTPALILNLPVRPDSTASETITVPAGSARRITVAAFDSAGVRTHAADTVLTLRAGVNPAVALRLTPLPASLGITVTFDGIRLTMSDTASRTLTEGDTVRLSAGAVRPSGIPVPSDSLVWATSNPAIFRVEGGLVRAVRAGSATLSVSFGGAAARVEVAVRTRSTIRLSDLAIIVATDSVSVLRVYSMRGDGTGRVFIAPGVHPTQVGDLVVTRGAFLDNSLYRMTGSGSGRTMIVAGGPSYSPDLNHDGTRLVFLRGDCGVQSHPIVTSNADGTSIAATGICSLTAPRWSPAGDAIAYGTAEGIWIASPSGASPRLVIDVRSAVGAPVRGLSWSPDGANLVFSARGAGEARSALFVVGTNGSGLRALTSRGAYDDDAPDWSDRGDWILFTSNRTGAAELWSIRADGTELTQVTSGSGVGAYDPRWVR